MKRLLSLALLVSAFLVPAPAEAGRQDLRASGVSTDQSPAIALANAQDRALANLTSLCDTYRGDLSKVRTINRNCNTSGDYTYCSVYVQGVCDY